MKVIVLDDEVKVCKLVCALIDWEKLNLTLCGTAHDGIEGIELIKKQKPDLLITDIRMPGLDGLNLIVQAKALIPDLKIIIISGHRQFDYAQTAIKYGVSDYLLKPINKEELEKTLKKKKKEFVLKNKQNAQIQDLTSSVKKTQQQALSENLKNFINSFDLKDIQKIPDTDLYRFIIVKTDSTSDDYSEESLSVIKNKIETQLQRIDNFKDYILCQNRSYTIILLPYNFESTLHIELNFKKYLPYILELSEIFSNFVFTLALGLEVKCKEQLQFSYNSAMIALNDRLTKKDSKIYTATKIPSNITFDIKEELLSSAFIQDNEDEIKEYLMKVRTWAQNDINVCLYILKSLLEASIKLAKIHLDETSYNSCYNNLAKLEFIGTKDKLVEESLSFVKTIYDKYHSIKKDEQTKPIKLALEYLENNYTDPQISLESVATIVGLNPSYFSALLKKDTKNGFVDILQNLRINKAKELLTTTNLNITQISIEIGYRDSKHFSKTFKKSCGLKPVEYRRLYG